MTPAIDRHGKDDQGADNDLLNIVGPTNLLTAAAQKSHDERADHRSENAAFAATQTATANNYGSDNVQFQTSGHRRIALAQAQHLHHTRQAKQQTGQRVDVNLETISSNAA